MEVFGVCAIARVTQDSYGLARLHVVALFFQQGSIMLIHREIAIFMLDADAVAIVDTPCGKHHSAVQGGINDLVSVGSNVDAEVTYVGIEPVDDGAVERYEEVLHQRVGLGGRQVVVTEEVILALGLLFGT